MSQTFISLPVKNKNKKKTWYRNHISFVAYAILFAFIGLVAVYGIIKLSSPLAIAYPIKDQYQFRLQLIIDGKAENFASDKYQLGRTNDRCSSELTSEPFSFRKNKDQIVDVHWAGQSNDPIEKILTGKVSTGGVTGGQILKSYGLNLIGGSDDVIGYRLDELFQMPPKIHPIQRFTKAIPEIPESNKFWVYTGDEIDEGRVEYRFREWNDFIWTPVEEFLAADTPIEQTINQNQQSSQSSKISLNSLESIIQNLTSLKAFAQDEELIMEAKTAQIDANFPVSPEKIRLEKVNNFIGNVVIFSQRKEPTATQINEKFLNLEPLDEMKCNN